MTFLFPINSNWLVAHELRIGLFHCQLFLHGQQFLRYHLFLSCVHQTHDRISDYHATILSYPYSFSNPIMSLSYPAHQTDPKSLIFPSLSSLLSSSLSLLSLPLSLSLSLFSLSLSLSLPLPLPLSPSFLQLSHKKIKEYVSRIL